MNIADVPAIDNSVVRDSVRVRCSFEGIHSLLAEILVFAFDPQGRLLDVQRLRRNVVDINFRAVDASTVHFVVSPAPEFFCSSDSEGATKGWKLSRESLSKGHVFEFECQVADIDRSITIPSVPKLIWQWWVMHSLWKKLRPKIGCA